VKLVFLATLGTTQDNGAFDRCYGQGAEAVSARGRDARLPKLGREFALDGQRAGEVRHRSHPDGRRGVHRALTFL
jgi:hypothetical protein